MIYKSRWHVPIPPVTLPTFLFDSPTSPLPNNPCFISATNPTNHILTYPLYRLYAQRLAAGLRAAGHRPGDRVLLFSGNTVFFPTVLLGVIMAEGIFTAANPGYNAREVAYQLENSGARFLICAEASLDTGLDAAKQAGLGRERVYVFDDGTATFDGVGSDYRRAGCRHWTALLASEDEGRRFEWRDEPGMVNDTVCLNYSSGTTGLPKGVEITHRNFVSNTLQHMYLMTLRKEFEKKREGYRWLCFLPMYHALAQTVFSVGGPKYRIPIYVMQKFDFQQMLENVQKFRISELQLVPPVVVALAKSPLTKRYDLSSVQSVGSGAAPLKGELAAELAKLWPPGVINLKQGYGMTELTCSAIGWDPNKHSDSYSVGEPNPNVEVRLVDPSNLQDVAQGDQGEFWIRCPNVMKGYWKNEKATRETLTEDGWLRTGDVGRADADGNFFVVDRMKELIKVKGNQVAPAELEGQLLENGAIADAAVIGVTIDGEELPRAYVVKAPGHDITPDAVVKYMEAKVSKHKHLTGGVKVVDAIMKNPSGKILRKMYREQAERELEASNAIPAKL